MKINYFPNCECPLLPEGPLGPAEDITLDTSNFDNNLSIDDNTVQKALNTLDDLIIPGFDGIVNWQESVLSISYAQPIGGESIGDRYIVPVGGTGTWVGQDNNIAEFVGLGWEYTTPSEGFAAWVEDTDTLYVFNGNEWVKFGSTVTHNNLNLLQGGAVNEYYHLSYSDYNILTNANLSVDDASLLHRHDNIYYTELEIDNILNNYQLKNNAYNMKVYSQTTEPDMLVDDINSVAIWIDTGNSNAVYFIIKRGIGDIVAVELT